jgi:hypothetical protein
MVRSLRQSVSKARNILNNPYYGGHRRLTESQGCIDYPFKDALDTWKIKNLRKSWDQVDYFVISAQINGEPSRKKLVEVYIRSEVSVSKREMQRQKHGRKTYTQLPSW